jgi:DNA repair exonuclease SbcCD nuclease subunit
MIKSNKIGCFSDVHIGINQDNPIWHKIVLEFAEWASKKYLELGINDIVIPGDIFHNRSEISVSTLDTAKKFFDYFKDFNLYISVGNHDSFYKDTGKVNSISIFDGWKNIKIIDDTPFELDIYNKKAVLVPWGTDIVDIPNVDIIFGHFEITSFYMNTYKVCEHGLKSADLFKKSKLIISGHFHKKDHRTYQNGEIVYLGSPYQQNFGDTLDSRGIYVYDVEKNNFEFIENKISPKHIKISIKRILSGEITVSFLKENIKNNHISLVVDTQLDEEKLILLHSKINKLEPISLRIDHQESEKTTSSLKENELKTVDLMQDIKIYVDSLDIENKKEVVSYVKELYNDLIK